MKRTILVLLCTCAAVQAQYMPRVNSGTTNAASTTTSNRWSDTQVFDKGAILDGSNPLLYFNPSGPGGYQLERFCNNEPGTADFGFALDNYQGSNGETRQDNDFQWGYNVSPYGRLNANEHSFTESIESRYKTSQGITQLEHYWGYTNAAGTNYFRPFSQTINLATDYTITGIRPDTLVIGDKSATYDWVSFSSSPNSGQITMLANSRFDYNGSNTDWLFQNGSALLGYESTQPNSGRLFPGANNLKLFATQNINDGLSITLGGYQGHTRGLRWNPGIGWQFQTSDTTWQNFGQILNYWQNGPFTGIGPTVFTPSVGLTTTLDVFDATPTSGATNLRVRLGAGQNRNPFEIDANDGSTQLYSVSQSGISRGYGYRTFGDEAALQYYTDPHALSLGSGVDIAFSSTSKWTGAKDVGLSRSAAGQIRVTNGSNGYGRLELGPSVTWRSGTGSPEGVVAASAGSLYTRLDGSTGTTLYVKESGTGNTGWIAK